MGKQLSGSLWVPRNGAFLDQRVVYINGYGEAKTIQQAQDIRGCIVSRINPFCLVFLLLLPLLVPPTDGSRSGDLGMKGFDWK